MILPLTPELVSSSLSLLCKVGNGLDHAFVKVDLRGRKLTDIGALSSFKLLRYVDVSENALDSLEPLGSLNELVTLKANHNKLTEFKLAPRRYLQAVEVADNSIASCASIAQPLLRSLKLSRNQLTSIADLSATAVPSLVTLDLVGNRFTSLESFAGLTNLTELYLASNGLSSLAGLTALVNLKRLHLRDNAIDNLDGLSADLKHLEYINLRQNGIATIPEVLKLAVLPALRTVLLLDNPVAEAAELRSELIIAIRHLQRLDKAPYEEEERNEALETVAKRAAERGSK